MSENSTSLSATDNPKIRKALLRHFYDQFEKQFEEIWKLMKGGTDKSLAGALAKDDVAIQLSEIIELARRRYDPAAFKENQSKRVASDALAPIGGSYFDVVKRGIQAAKIAVENIDIFIASMMTLDVLHIQKTMETLNSLSGLFEIPVFEIDFFQFLRSVSTTRRDIDLCATAMMLATAQKPGKRGRGRPPSIYVPLVIDLAVLWKELTGNVIVMPKSRRRDKQAIRPGSPQISTQFVWLALRLVDPKITLQQAETAIRNALPVLRVINGETYYAKRKTAYKSLIRDSETSEFIKLLKLRPDYKKR
jgi:hypothetical protein